MASTLSKGQEAGALKILKCHFKKEYEDQEFEEAWRNLPEVPTQGEVMPACNDHNSDKTRSEPWDRYQQEHAIYEPNPNLPHNIVDGPWPSKEAFVGAQYQILREDAIAGLRRSVADIKATPNMQDSKDTCIYDHVSFKGILLSSLGAAFRVEFSTERAGKQIRWGQSKRLVAGTIVALTPQRDMFRSICKIAVVAARPILGGLDQNPPLIDLFWSDPNDAVVDPVGHYVMVESRTGYYEASRHMLVAMQKLMTEKFHLAKHIALLYPDVKAPEYLEEHPFMDLRSLVRPELEAQNPDANVVNLESVDVLRDFPAIDNTGMDPSQMAACKSMLTKRVAIVQGPPGTGKTFVSVNALRAMVQNHQPGDPPIIVTAQTNHALDQLLNHIMEFEPNVLRLGGRSDPSNLAIRKRTLYELRVSNPIQGTNASLGRSRRELKARAGNLHKVISPLLVENLLTAEILHENGLITDAQRDSLSDDGWGGNGTNGDIDAWVGDQLMPIPVTPSVNFGLPLEEEDIEYEQQQDLELEMTAADAPEDKERDGLAGTYLGFRRKLTGRHVFTFNEKKVKKLLAGKKNLYDIPVGERGNVYRFWELKLNKSMEKNLRSHLKLYQAAVDDGRVHKGLANIQLMHRLGIKLVGCTTTGLSKYRGFLAALRPRTMLIEEAAEALEGTVVAGMLDSLEQLILVGDHQQLQAHCNIGALENLPFHLNISMFERLVQNGIPYVMLNKQRRMIPDVRKLLCIDPAPFYNDLHDHPSVLDRVNNRPPVPGMGGRDTYFFHHTWPEARNEDSSRYNQDEAEMIAAFFNYLVLNGVEPPKITVLSFYNGQRKRILQELKKHQSLKGYTYFHVHTVDSYQGEENDVILLSLVRSNEHTGIGFLDNKNRLVVALSRARRGLYIFGNAVTLTNAESSEQVIGREALYYPLITFMKNGRRFDLDGGLPVACAKHGITTRIFEAEHWVGNAGGCGQPCGGLLDCAHPCPYPCHPFEHSSVLCQAPCGKQFPCGHGCSRVCSEKCICLQCDLDDENGNDIIDNRLLNLHLDNLWPDSDFLRDSPPRRSRDGAILGVQVSGSARVAFTGSPSKSRFTDVRNELRHRPGPSTPKKSTTPNNISPLKRFGQDASTPHRRGNMSNPSSGKKAISSPAVWSAWNAAEADQKVAERVEKERAESGPRVETVYKETYRPTKVKNGVRVFDPSGPIHSLVGPEKKVSGGDHKDLISFD